MSNPRYSLGVPPNIKIKHWRREELLLALDAVEYQMSRWQSMEELKDRRRQLRFLLDLPGDDR